MLILKLFNAVISKKSNEKPYISGEGYIIHPNALWAKDRIIDFYKKEKLSGNDLNKTFHKSWEKIKNSTRFELLLHQILHYISTYGSDFQDEIYIPNEIVKIPEDVKLKYIVVNAYTKEQLIEKCLYLLKSGIALKEETINDLLSLLGDELKYEFTGQEGIRNKEAIIKIADLYGVLPSDTMEFFRYILYRTIGNSLLIKNHAVIEMIKISNYNPYVQFNKFGLERLATIFNRFKPLFLAYKTKCPSTINKISKLSKQHHKPLISNPLNNSTSRTLDDSHSHWLDNATIYALFKAMSACYSRIKGQDSFVYRIRNGKSWTTKMDANISICKKNFLIIGRYLKEKYPLSGVKIRIPKDVLYALPTSEKMFIGNIPTGTRFYGERLAIGIYWEDSWGANDLDLSGINIGGKVGWNAAYCADDLYYSGDITSAPRGAVEYLYANHNMNNNTLIKCNVYSGQDDSGYKIIIGRGDNIDKKYMMNPEKLFAEIKCNAIQKQMILGMLMPQKTKQCFVLLNFGAGHTRVSGNSKISEIATKALYQQWNNPLSFNKIIKFLGAKIVQNDDVDHDLSLDMLEKDSFVKVFNETK